MIPVWLGYACIIYYSYAAKHAELTGHAQESARALRQAVELKLVGVESALSALSTSPSIDQQDFEAFHRQTRAVLKEFEGADIILADETAQQLVNSYLPPGTPLPRRKNADMIQRLFATGRPQISGPFKGAVTQRHLVGLDIPVWRDSRIAFDLGMTFPADRFAKVMDDLKFPPGWIGAILSADGKVIARTREMDKHVGATVDIGVSLEWLFAQEEITLETSSLEGEPLISSFCRSDRFGWMVAVSMPRRALMDSLHLWIASLLAFSALLAAVALGLAHLASRRIASEFTSLAQSAEKMRQGAQGTCETLSLAESYRLGEALEASFRRCEEEAALRQAAQDQLRGHLKTLEDVIAQRTQELSRANNYINNIIDSMPSMLVCVDKDMRLTRLNVHAAAAAGVQEDEALGKPLAELFPALKLSAEAVSNVISSRQPESPVRRELPSAGDNRFVDIMVYPLVSNCVDGAVVRVDDVTDRVRLESIRRQNEKMMVLGSLAAGVAHEINNPLSIISQSLQVAARRVQPALEANRRAASAMGVSLEQVHAYLAGRGVLEVYQDIHDAVSRAASIVRTMLAFARGGEVAFGTHSLNALVRLAVEHVRSEITSETAGGGQTPAIRLETPEQDVCVLCAGDQLDQVFTNILRNAVHALRDQRKEGAAPEIVVRTWSDRGYAFASFADNGPGIAPQTLERIFEPFFTTGKRGGGTGLGLSISYFIVKNIHQGTLTASSTPGEGAMFTVGIPLRQADDQAAVA